MLHALWWSVTVMHLSNLPICFKLRFGMIPSSYIILIYCYD